MENCNSRDINSASITKNATESDQLTLVGHYNIECVGVDGQIKWTEVACNLVVNQGKNNMLDTYFAGSAYTGAWYCSLITSGSAIATSTYLVPTVVETTNSIIANRVLMTWSVASTGSKSAALVTFPIIGTATISGNMIVSGGAGITTIGNTTATGGVLFSAANFSGGSKTVGNGDTLNVSYSLSV